MTWDVATARVRLGLAEDDSSKDPQILSAMAIALAAAEAYCDRRFLKQQDTDEFVDVARPVLLVRRYPLASLVGLMPLGPLADPPPEPMAIPAKWRIDQRRGMVYMVGGGPAWPIAEVGSAPAPVAWPPRGGFALTYVGGYEPLPADLEAALWMAFDAVWWTTPGYGLPGGTQTAGGSGAVRAFTMDGTRIEYDTSVAKNAAGSGRPEAWGILPATAVGILDLYRAETAWGGA